MADNRKVVTVVCPDGTIIKRLAKVCKADQRAPDLINKLCTGRVRGPRCRRCGIVEHHLDCR